MPIRMGQTTASGNASPASPCSAQALSSRANRDPASTQPSGRKATYKRRAARCQPACGLPRRWAPRP
eukprot:5871384-Alexandrium_andersonii.AAC.1